MTREEMHQGYYRAFEMELDAYVDFNMPKHEFLSNLAEQATDLTEESYAQGFYACQAAVHDLVLDQEPELFS